MFLCHSGEEKPGIISHIAKAFEQNGWSCFLDVKSMRMGDRPDETIKPAIERAEIVVVLNSPSFIGRWFPMLELSWVANGLDASKRTVVPVFYQVSRDECKSSRLLWRVWWKLGGVQLWLGVSKNTRWRDLMDKVATAVSVDYADKHHK